MLRRSGPDLAQTWHQTRQATEIVFFFCITVGRGTSFLRHGCTPKMLGIVWGIQMCMQSRNYFPDP